jgi:hypothetical protein
MKTIVRNLLAAIILITASIQTHAQSTLVYDQQSATGPKSPTANDFFNIQADSPLLQSFIPVLSTIGFVQFQFWDIANNGTNGATVSVNLWTGSPNTNSATLLGSTAPVYMPNGFVNNGLGFAGITNFNFSTPIALNSGQTYYLQPVVLSGDNPWAIAVFTTNSYPNGSLFVRGTDVGIDSWFREGVVPEPSTLVLIGLSSMFLYFFKRRSKLVVLFATGVLFTASLQCNAQGLVYDQQTAINPVTSGGDGLNIQSHSLTQAFIPMLSAIDFVQFEFWDVNFLNNGTNGATVKVNLWEGSPNINSATLLGSTTPVYMPNHYWPDISS